MKKFLSFFLSVLMLFSLTVTASAVSLSEGADAIYKSFNEGKSALDYVYFSPVKGENDTTKYPLVLWLHGNASGDYAGHQLKNTDIYKFASDELQARFVGAGGAFLLLPRDPSVNIGLAWDLTIDKAKSVLDRFIEENTDNIDTDRIYVGGNSMGGKGVYKIATDYTGVFAAIFPVSPVYIPSNAELKKLSDTAVWVFNNSNDNYPQLSDTAVKTYFNYLNKHSEKPQNNRWSCFSEYYSTGGFVREDEIHNTWTPVLNDLFMDDGREYLAMSTVDGNGNTVRLNYPDGFISWLSSQSLGGDVNVSVRNPFAKIIDFFISIFNAIISIFGL